MEREPATKESTGMRLITHLFVSIYYLICDGYGVINKQVSNLL